MRAIAAKQMLCNKFNPWTIKIEIDKTRWPNLFLFQGRSTLYQLNRAAVLERDSSILQSVQTLSTHQFPVEYRASS